MSFNVIVVDDSSSMRSVIKKIITMSGFKMDHCFEAGNGREGLEVMSNNWVDVVVTDINMPVMTGIEMLQEMKKDKLLREIPIIVVSTEANTERVREAIESGASGFIKKPFTPEECRKTLHEVIGVDEDGNYQDDDEGLDF